MSQLRELESRYDFAIPRLALDYALSGRSPSETRLMAARARAQGCRYFVLGQIRVIRRRRADGTLYPELTADFRCYWRAYRAAMREVAASREVVDRERRLVAQAAE